MYNYREEQLKLIVNLGIYWMANKEISQSYVDELHARGYNFYLIHGLGSSGVNDVIFNKESFDKVRANLRDSRDRAKEELDRTINALETLNKIESSE